MAFSLSCLCCCKPREGVVEDKVADKNHNIACNKIFSAALAVLGALAIGAAVAVGILFNAAVVFTIGTWACSGVALAVILGVTGGVLGTTSIVTCSATISTFEPEVRFG